MKGSNVREERATIMQKLWDFLVDKAVLSLIIGSIFYYLGWRYLSAYYGNFGIEPFLLTFSMIEIFAGGWRIYLVLIVLAYFFLNCQNLCFKSVSYLAKRIGAKTVSLIAKAVLVLGFVISGLTTLNYIFLWVDLKPMNYVTLVLLALGLLYFSYTLLAGFKYSKNSIKKQRNWLKREPGKLGMIIFLHLPLMVILTSKVAAHYAQRDMGEKSRLNLVTIITAEKVAIPKGRALESLAWQYEELRFLLLTDRMYFFFYPKTLGKDQLEVYAVPRESVKLLKLQHWK